MIATAKWQQPYPEYKDSGVEWLGEIPTHWDIRPLFTLASENKQRNADSRESNVLSLSYGRIIRRDVSSNFGLLPESFDTYQIVEQGDIVLRLTDLQNDQKSLRVGLVKEKGVITSAYVGLKFHQIDQRFCYYLLHSYDLAKIFYSLGGGVRQSMNYADLKHLPLLLPPSLEQQAIAGFLDHETAKFDTLIGELDDLIQLVAEKRQAIISHAVTRGINPNVALVESGVEWIGKIPEHWDVINLKYLSESIQTGPFGSQLHAEEYVDGGVPIINPSHIRDGRIVPDPSVSVDPETWSRLSRHHLIEGDIVFARRGEMGRCGLVEFDQDGWICGTGSLRVRLNRSLANPKFMNIALSLRGIKEWLELESVGSTLDNLNTEIVGNISLPVPPIIEQIEVTGFLNDEIRKLDELTRAIQKTIQLLYDRRAALIEAAVSGKIRIVE